MRNAILCIALTIFIPALATGQQYKVLYSFLGSSAGDGDQPRAGLVVDRAGNLYGTTRLGGSRNTVLCTYIGCGTVFEVSPNNDGTWTEKTIYTFCPDYGGYACPDGEHPMAGLVLDDAGNLYGTTSEGGSEPCPTDSGGCGLVFELSPPSSPGGEWTQTVLYNFCTSYPVCPDGEVPQGDLIFDTAGNLYGTTYWGGANYLGTVFELSPGPNGWTETVLYSFCSVRTGSGCLDGAEPVAGPSFDTSGNLYGTTELGGKKNGYGGGVMYALSPGPSGWSERVVQAFPIGGEPRGVVTVDQKGNLFTTLFGSNGQGGAFRARIDDGKTDYLGFNGAGYGPAGGLLVDPKNDWLYGTASYGAGSGFGSVLMIAGRQVTVLHSFLGGADGAYPEAGLVGGPSRHLYGTTSWGGINNGCAEVSCGVVFEIAP